MHQFITLLITHNAKQYLLFITYLINFYHFDELSSHTTVALAQPQYILRQNAEVADSIMSSTSIIISLN